MSALLADVRGVLQRAGQTYAETPALATIDSLTRRLDEPLRVAIAGKVKAGKSTLLNGLVGEELAPTDAGECTKIVTWYVNGLTYRVSLEPHDGAARDVPFSREHGAIDIDLGGMSADDIERLVVEWPTASLRAMTLIDTPGIASLSTTVSARTHAFLSPGDDHITPADAVLYLMRHLHTSDVNFLETFHDQEFSQPTPVNAVAVLSRADEIGVGRLDAMASAARIAARYRADQKIRRLCQTVVPVAGLLAESGTTLREAEFKAIALLREVPLEETEGLLLSADRFVHGTTTTGLTPIERQQLLERFGLFGIRLGIELVRSGAARSSTELSEAMVARSGLRELEQVLHSQFAARREVLKSRSALLGLEALLRADPAPGSDAIASDVERITAGAHEFAEIRLLNSLRAGAIDVKPAEVEAMERLLGGAGASIAARLGLPETATADELRAALQTEIARWQRRAENPLSSREVADAARDLVRTCAGIYVQLH
ncbi:MAG: dynamin family protein [Acidimicrobiales bacterium]